MRFVSRLAIPLVLAVAACAQKPPPPPASPAPPPPLRAADGTYVGTSTRFQADSRACPSPGRVTLRVLDGVFSYRVSARMMVLATVQPDGTVSGSEGDFTLSGRVEGGRITGDVTSANCAYHFTATEHRPPVRGGAQPSR